MTQTEFAIDPTEFPVNPELESIMKEQRGIAAKMLVDDLNNKFFESVSTGLVDGQQITFHDKDGSRYIIKKDSVKVLHDDEVDFIENEKGFHLCPNCKRKVDKMKVTFFSAHLFCAIRAYEHAIKTGSQYIQIKDLGLRSEFYGNMNTLIRFGLAFRNKEIKINGSNVGVYGIPRKRIFDFISGNWSVAKFYVQDPTLPEGHKNKREMSEERITIDQVPSILKFREKLGGKLTEFVWTEPDEFINENCF